MHLEWLSHDFFGGHARVEARQRVLKYDLHVTAERFERALRKRVNRSAKPDDAP